MNNLELIKLAYESFGKGDMETFSSLLSDQYVFKVPGDFEHAGVFNGAEDTNVELDTRVPMLIVAPGDAYQQAVYTCMSLQMVRPKALRLLRTLK